MFSTMKNSKLDLIELIKQCPGTSISIGAAELGMFAKQLIAEARREFERERAAIEAGKAELYRTPVEVLEMLSISSSTLYRMSISKILEPIWVAGQKRYRQSDIDKMVRREQNVR